MKQIFLLLIALTLNTSFSIAKDKKLKSGTWRTEFKLTNKANLPVIIEYNKKTNSIVLINASERIPLKNVQIINDQITVKFPIFNSELKGKIVSKKRIEGFWHNYSKGKDYKIPFISICNSKSRFDKTQTNSDKFEGKWEVTFDYNESKEKAIGLFENVKGSMHGTFLTETGDYRFLEGVISKNSLELSCFDGSHAFLFTSELKNDTLWGEFYSGTHYKTNWFAIKNEKFELRDPEKLTYLVNDDPIEFNLPQLDGNEYSYPNKSTENKVVLIQIMGTWCPNCMDETNYLTELYAKHKKDIEIIGIGFEVGKTDQDRINTVLKYKNHMDINYPLLVGGDACKPCAIKVFPMLNSVMSFPTLIIIDKKGEVRKIHTGFSGPSTGKYYTDYVTNTNQFVKQLIEE
jgi:thiol-disulfide isomerase/thioredoxin